ncbi:TPA: amidophosphoribosyltransferase [bacterium]|nr:amidophosphoribosyltransferase [bacterium]
MCGIFGVFNFKEAADLVYLGLFALQHRGQESAGIVSSDGDNLYIHRGTGLVSQVFNRDDFAKLPGDSAIGHVKYSTTGSSRVEEAQPLLITYGAGLKIALAHNGNIVNSGHLRGRLEREGAIFQTTSDSEVILHRLARAKEKDLILGLIYALSLVKGAYSILILTKDKMIAVRDPFGFRPLSIGKKDRAFFVSSETCAFDLVGCEYVRDVLPGEIVKIDKDGIHSYQAVKPSPQMSIDRKHWIIGDHELHYKVRNGYCIFEQIYFSRPDSLVFSEKPYDVRKRLGRQLAIEARVDADIVVPIPDSGTMAALGFSQESNVPFEIGLVQNHYIGRTFIYPKQKLRKIGVEIKLNPVPEILKGKKVVLVDDSIVRGTTCRRIIKMIRDAGSSEVHLRISSPPVKFPCFYGIDTPTKEELIANNKSLEEIESFMGADSVRYISIDGMLSCVKNPSDCCTACFSGDYPVI